jgi:hypothetical protein
VRRIGHRGGTNTGRVAAGRQLRAVRRPGIRGYVRLSASASDQARRTASRHGAGRAGPGAGLRAWQRSGAVDARGEGRVGRSNSISTPGGEKSATSRARRAVPRRGPLRVPPDGPLLVRAAQPGADGAIGPFVIDPRARLPVLMACQPERGSPYRTEHSERPCVLDRRWPPGSVALAGVPAGSAGFRVLVAGWGPAAAPYQAGRPGAVITAEVPGLDQRLGAGDCAPRVRALRIDDHRGRHASRSRAPEAQS